MLSHCTLTACGKTFDSGFLSPCSVAGFIDHSGTSAHSDKSPSIVTGLDRYGTAANRTVLKAGLKGSAFCARPTGSVVGAGGTRTEAGRGAGAASGGVVNEAASPSAARRVVGWPRAARRSRSWMPAVSCWYSASFT